MGASHWVSPNTFSTAWHQPFLSSPAAFGCFLSVRRVPKPLKSLLSQVCHGLQLVVTETFSHVLCYLVPINEKSCAHRALRGFREMPHLHISFQGLILIIGKCKAEARSWDTLSPVASLSHWYCALRAHLHQNEHSSEQWKDTLQVFWISGCTQLGLSGALLLHSHYFLECGLCTG